MPITEQIKRQIRDAFNEALSDFNSAYLGVIPANVDCNDSYNTSHYEIIKCDEDYEIEEYINNWVKRIYERLKTEMYRPLYPVVELEIGDGAYTIELGYGIYGMEIPFIRNLMECGSDSDADDDDDEWMDVYDVGTFERFCKNQPQLQKYADCTYYQCWGGGPEGGYLHRRCPEDSSDDVYRVNRTWGEPFTVEPVIGARTIEVQDTGTNTGSRIRIIN